jgi:diguanylate cyclase (GGDEF)-like protein/PAS domain S-box-containing protein
MPTDPQALLSLTLQSVRDAVATTDAHARMTSWNAAAAALTGWTEEEVLGRPVEEILNLREYGTDSPLPNPTRSALLKHQLTRTPSHCLLIGKDGRRVSVHLAATSILDAHGEIIGCLVVFYDASEAIRLAERISYLAQHDPLTGLPNRILFADRLDQATRLADRTRESVAVVFLDLDSFHQLNAAFGHAAADEFLKEIAYRLTGALRETDSVCRMGGDEFVLLLTNVRSIATVDSLAAKLLQEVGLPFQWEGKSLQSTCSMGVSVYPSDAGDGETIMQLADGAMHKAKKAGRNRFVFARDKSTMKDSPEIVPAPFNTPFH